MKNVPCNNKLMLTAALVMAALLAASNAIAQGPGRLRRLSAQFLKFDGTEAVAQSTDTVDADNGVEIYEEEVSVPSELNVLYVTLSATGDVNGTDVAAWFSCLVDGKFCNRGATFATKRPGWISLLADSEESEHDSNVNYTWCTQIKPTGPAPKGLRHEVAIRMASNGGGNAYLEGIHVFVDASYVTDGTLACTASLAD